MKINQIKTYKQLYQWRKEQEEKIDKWWADAVAYLESELHKKRIEMQDKFQNKFTKIKE